MTRALTAHQVNDQNKHVEILAPTVVKGQVPCTYRVVIHTKDEEAESTTKVERILQFQRGPIEEGINGNVTDESLLAILADRWEHFTDVGYAEAKQTSGWLRTILDNMFKRRGAKR